MVLETNVKGGKKTKGEERAWKLELGERRRGNSEGMQRRKENRSGPGDECGKGSEEEGDRRT